MLGRAARQPSPAEGLAETLREHFQAVSALVGQGAAEVEINAALAAAEAAGLDRTALRMAVREGRIADKERRAEVACRLDYYRVLLDRPDTALAVETKAAPGVLGPKGGRLR